MIDIYVAIPLLFAAACFGFAFGNETGVRRERERGKTTRWAKVMEDQAEARKLIHSAPEAYKLDVVDNGEQGWKWLVWDWDPDSVRMMAGAVEGSIVPHGLKAGYSSMDECTLAGIEAIRKGGWDGFIILDQRL